MSSALHKDDIPWYQASLPRRLHRCKPQTVGVAAGHVVDRCVCGAIRISGFGRFWTERNSRRKR